MTFFKLLIFTLIIFYLSIGLYLYLNQKDFLYFPSAKIDNHYKKLTITNNNRDINIFVLNPNQKNAMLYFGGNAESMAQSCDYLSKEFPSFTIYLMDYRGYGLSEGSPSQEGIYRDSLTLYDKIKPHHNQIYVEGRSLGSGVATYVSARREVSKLILLTPYYSILSVAQAQYKIYPLSLLLKDQYLSYENIANIKAQTLVILAQNDMLISSANSQKLIDKFKKEKVEVEILKERTHGDIVFDEKYYHLIRNFIKNK